MKLTILFLVTLLITGTSLANAPLPVEAFASLANVSQLQLAPDGKHTVSLVRFGSSDSKHSGTLVTVNAVDSEKIYHILRTDNKKFVINWIRWANNRQVLVSARFPAQRYGIPTTETRAVKIDFEERIPKPIISRIFFSKQSWIPQFQDNVIDILPSDSDNILMALSLSKPSSSSVHKVNLKTGQIKRVQRNKSKIQDWITDRQNRVRVAIHFDDTEYQIKVRNLEEKKWEALWTFNSFSEDQVWPLGFDSDPNILYVNAYHQGKLAIFKMDLSVSPPAKELVLNNPQYDVDGSLIYSTVKNEVIGATHSDDSGYLFWHPEYKGLQKGINKALPNTTNYIYSFSENERRYVVLATSDIDAGTFYVGDRDEKRLYPIAYRYTDLIPELMAEKQSLSYQARDGLEIEAFLTLPKGEIKKSLPSVIFPHGGPISYDNSGFDYWTQFFANRGYAVLQMNFRGSSGYGFDFMTSGLKNWGQEMQNDVEDGTRWLIEQGIADPERICIVGASYGGYAALMEATKSPSLYQCAISFAGVSDVEYLVKSSRRYLNHQVVKEQIGSDYKQLRKYSPVRHAKKMVIPILLVHGSKDRSVRVNHSRKMAKALKKAKKSVHYIEQKNGDHYLSNQTHRIELFNAMEQFLNKYLAPKTIANNEI